MIFKRKNNMKSIKSLRIGVLLLMAVCGFSSCDSDWWNPDPIIIPVGNSSQSTTLTTITINGVSLSYSISAAKLKVGETLSIKIDSENEVKPYVGVFVGEAEVMMTNELPATYSQKMQEKGEYKITFKVYKEKDVLYFETSSQITVE